MAHQQQVDFCLSVKRIFPQFFLKRLVVDIGSLDINGNNRYLFEYCLYIGVDLLPGRNVDLTSKGHDLGFPDGSVDVIISTECFEHDQFYRQTLNNAVRMLKPGGLLLFSCATTGRPEHGTRRTTPADAPFTLEFGDWGDYYKNLEEADIRNALDFDSEFEKLAFSTNDETHDLYFWGIKKGVLVDRADYSFLIGEDSRDVHIRFLYDKLSGQDERINRLQRSLIEKDAQSDQTERVSAALKEHVADLERRLADGEVRLASSESRVLECREQILGLEVALKERDALLANTRRDIGEHQSQAAHFHHGLIERDVMIERLISSKSWRLTKPLRFANRLLNGEFETAFSPFFNGDMQESKRNLSRASNAVRYVLRGDIRGLRDRLKLHQREARLSVGRESATGKNTWAVMATPHTRFVAHLIAEQLKRNNASVEILYDAPAAFTHDWYVVICAQMFSRLPPGEKRIVFQLEQSVSSRWFTNKYFNILENSLAVLEYALVNIDFMAHRGVSYPHVYYLPIGCSKSYGKELPPPLLDKKCQVLFYGDSNSSVRRRSMLDALMTHFDVRVISEVFGVEMMAALREAAVVINIHYYENALLEMPRIQECLSLGVPVVSEMSQDQNDYPELEGAVRFFEQGSIPAMLAAVQAALNEPVLQEVIAASVSASDRRFSFMFDRFLIGQGFLPAKKVQDIELPLPSTADRIALSLPETIGRRKGFEAERPAACAIFDGFRRRPGWVGCGLSYLSLAQHGLKNGLPRITVMEDDVDLPPDLEGKLSVINEFLGLNFGKWDVFAGVIAALHENTEILAVDEFKGVFFITINKMTSMVFNIYSDNAMRLLASWDPEDEDPELNTIDRYIESQKDLRVVVTLPFFVGHREEVYSTLWGFKNTRYSEMISASQLALREKVEAFQYSRQ